MFYYKLRFSTSKNTCLRQKAYWVLSSYLFYKQASLKVLDEKIFPNLFTSYLWAVTCLHWPGHRPSTPVGMKQDGSHADWWWTHSRLHNHAAMLPLQSAHFLINKLAMLPFCIHWQDFLGFFPLRCLYCVISCFSHSSCYSNLLIIRISYSFC